MRTIRNCRNRHGVKHPILQGKKEWQQVSSTLRHVLKIADIKFFECPVSAIKPRTWARMRLVNETTGGEHTEIHASIRILEQPPWYLEAVQIVRRERSEHRQREMKKLKES